MHPVGVEWATSTLPLSFTLTSDPHPLLDLGWDTEGVELRGAVAAQAGLPLRLKVREHQFCLAFALTDFKLQGRTLPKLILCLADRRKAPWITLAAFYVFISRVRRADSLRLLQYNATALDKVAKLRHDDYLGCWERGYDADGWWSDARAAHEWAGRKARRDALNEATREEMRAEGKKKREAQVQARREAAKKAKHTATVANAGAAASVQHEGSGRPPSAPQIRPVPVAPGKRQAVPTGGVSLAPPSPPTAWPPTCLCDADAAPEALMPAAGTEEPASDAAFAPGLSWAEVARAWHEAADASTVCHLAVEGGVGVGKSTCIAALAARFADDPAIVVLPEPVEDWRKSGLLRRMYDGSMSSLEFQTVALATIVGPLLEALHRPGVRLVVTERSPRSSREIFAALNLSGEDMVAFDLAYNALWRVLPARLEVTAYLEASVEAVMERVEARGRPEEQGLSRGFHESLRRLHEELFRSIAHPKHRVDAAATPEQVGEAVGALAASLLREGSMEPATVLVREHTRRKAALDGDVATAEDQPWAPRDIEELLDAIATQDYGVSDDRSSKLTAPALRAYNKALKSEYGHYELRRGRTLPEGFTIVKVSGTAVRPHAPFGYPHHICSLLMAHLLTPSMPLVPCVGRYRRVSRVHLHPRSTSWTWPLACSWRWARWGRSCHSCPERSEC